MEFYEATAIEESERFLENCDFIGGSLGWVVTSSIIM